MRRATLDLTPELFVEFAKLCKSGLPRRIVVKENPLPDDARIVDIRLKDTLLPYTLQLVLESESFNEVATNPDSAMPPRLPELPLVVFETQSELKVEYDVE